MSGSEELGDAEVEELQRAIVGHQDVRRLEVPVDDEVAVGVLHGVAHVEEEFQSSLDRQATRVAVSVDRFSLDVLHREPGQSVRSHAPVEEASDVRVLE